ncbi:MAG TPA: TonB-dependent receptor [Salinimicrobium sp.]|nr:TonB-dependent receptor [Salinimicrobium sp.]
MFFLSGFVFAQDDDPIDSETVVVIKPYTPSVGDVFKIKETPPSGDSLGIEKKEVEYHINSVPVASTFEPAKGRAANLERNRTLDVYNSYFTLGFGSYTSALAEFYTNFEISKSDNFGIFLTHNSSQGGIKDVVLDDEFYNTDFNLNYSSRNRDRTWRAQAGVKHQLINWYGLPEELVLPETELNTIDPQQNYLDIYAGVDLALEDSFFKNGKFDISRFGDSYDSAEIHAVLKPTFEFEIAEELITTTLTADYLNGSFEDSFFENEDMEGLNYGFLSLGLNPSLLILRDDLTINLGVEGVYSMDMENSESKFFVYPKITASYRVAGEYFIAYGGLEGELQQNSYNKFSQENPFIAPTIGISPTDRQYNGYLGVKGKVASNINFNFRGSYITENAKPLFISAPYTIEMDNRNNYDNGNSFQVVYDDVKTMSFFGELNFEANSNFSLGLNAEILSFETANQDEPWNLPDMKASLVMDYQITDKWYAGANVFYRGERKDLRIVNYPIDPSLFLKNLDSYLDANAHFGYRFNNQLSAFVRGNNLLGNNYERWLDYPVQGIQVMAGATYKFDF